MFKIDRLDHFVLTVRDLAATCDFYVQVLGMELLEFDNGRYALRFGQQKINLHQAGREFVPKAATPLPGSADFCLLTTTPINFVIDHVRACGIKVIEGPVTRTGAVSPITSIYLRDPDNNLIEIANLQRDLAA